MKCPIDGENLVMTERQGIEIDYCPKCRGVWLDRGELDKIIERAAPTPVTPPVSGGLFGGPPPPREDRRYDARRQEERRQDAPRYQARRDDDDDDDNDRRARDVDPRYGQDPRDQKRKRGGFLGDLFDFD